MTGSSVGSASSGVKHGAILRQMADEILQALQAQNLNQIEAIALRLAAVADHHTQAQRALAERKAEGGRSRARAFRDRDAAIRAEAAEMWARRPALSASAVAARLAPRFRLSPRRVRAILSREKVAARSSHHPQ